VWAARVWPSAAAARAARWVDRVAIRAARWAARASAMAARQGSGEAATAWRMARFSAAVTLPLGRGVGISSGGCPHRRAANAGGRWAQRWRKRLAASLGSWQCV
jgi:hypothetical protein